MIRVRERIAVIGGGVIGITTATLLQASGHETELYALVNPADVAFRPPPAFASSHAAASILPHSVASASSTRWTAASQEYFRCLASLDRSCVREQRHYEIFETDGISPPIYHRTVRNFELLTEAALRTRGAPIRPGAASASGWCFSMYFCEAPRYLRFLYGLYEAIGGKIVPAAELPKPSNLANYLALDHQVFVLCAGQASPGLLSDVTTSGGYTDRPSAGAFEPIADHCEPTLIRGHYLSVRLAGGLCDNHGRLYSYNYTPTRDVYPTDRASASDVYCYPRSVGWLLGGSRQVGQLDENDDWTGESTASDEVGFPTNDGTLFVPAPIFNLNRDLLRATGGPDLDRLRTATPTQITAGVGYRFVRNDVHENVRVGASRLVGTQEKIVVHNYGHGGAGYTLSWGCALDVLTMVDRFAQRALPHGHLDHPAAAAISGTSGRLLRRA